jgi:hypothetical protein
VSHNLSLVKPTTLEGALKAIDFGELAFFVRTNPERHMSRLVERVKFAAKLLSRVTKIQHSRALDTVAHAVRFPTWHHLLFQLELANGTPNGGLSDAWFNSFSGAVVLWVEPEKEVPLAPVQIEAFERFGQTLAMLTDVPVQSVLDDVCAGLCAGRNWADVRALSPLKATSPLYSFVVDSTQAGECGHGGGFVDSAACRALIEELDDKWQGYDQFSKPEKRQARQWVETALASQPGFLEAGLALAWMQRDAGEPEATSTVARFIKQSEALIPQGFRGLVPWGNTNNRFYHRLLWLQMELYHEVADLPSAMRVGRKQLRLNPGDNLGLRFVMPLMQLEQLKFEAARREAEKNLQGEWDVTAKVITAFCEYAVGNQAEFRHGLASSLISLPWLRLFLLNQSKPLPDGDDGFRTMRPDEMVFSKFVRPAYRAVPGLMNACKSFLAEPLVLQAEAELRQYWKGYWRKGDAERIGTHDGWDALVSEWTGRLAG